MDFTEFDKKTEMFRVIRKRHTHARIIRLFICFVIFLSVRSHLYIYHSSLSNKRIAHVCVFDIRTNKRFDYNEGWSRSRRKTNRKITHTHTHEKHWCVRSLSLPFYEFGNSFVSTSVHWKIIWFHDFFGKIFSIVRVQFCVSCVMWWLIQKVLMWSLTRARVQTLLLTEIPERLESLQRRLYFYFHFSNIRGVRNIRLSFIVNRSYFRCIQSLKPIETYDRWRGRRDWPWQVWAHHIHLRPIQFYWHL